MSKLFSISKFVGNLDFLQLKFYNLDYIDRPVYVTYVA